MATAGTRCAFRKLTTSCDHQGPQTQPSKGLKPNPPRASNPTLQVLRLSRAHAALMPRAAVRTSGCHMERARTWMATYMAGTLKSSNISVVIRSLRRAAAARAARSVSFVQAGSDRWVGQGGRHAVGMRVAVPHAATASPQSTHQRLLVGHACNPRHKSPHLLIFGFMGASVSITGRVLMSTRSSLSKVWRQMASISSLRAHGAFVCRSVWSTLEKLRVSALACSGRWLRRCQDRGRGGGGGLLSDRQCMCGWLLVVKLLTSWSQCRARWGS